MRLAWVGLVVVALLPAELGGAGEAVSGHPMTVVDEDGLVTISTQEGPVLRYPYQDVPFKPYVQAFYTPAGVNVLRDAPQDHLHHHALMFAMKVNGVNFWEERGKPGRQAHRGEIVTKLAHHGGLPWAGFVERLDWVDTKDGTVLLKEQRTIAVAPVKDSEATLLVWESRFEVAGDAPAELGGAHYHGLGMRFVVSMDEDGTFLNADDVTGEIVRGDERLTPSRWCAYTAKADGKPVAVAVFDSPANPRQPALWFTMHTPFAYLAATMNLWKEPFEVKPGETPALRYGVALWDGPPDRERIEGLYRRWLGWEGPVLTEGPGCAAGPRKGGAP